MKLVESTQPKKLNKLDILYQVFPAEYVDIMSDKCKVLFLNSFKTILKQYPSKNNLGYKSKGQSVLYPKLKDLIKPYNLCKLEDIKGIVLAVEPYNNGEATGIPFQFSMDYRASFQLSNKQQDVEAIDYAVRANFSTFTSTEVDKYNKDGSLSKRKRTVVTGHVVNGVDWEHLSKQGILVIHTSLTCEEGKELKHLKTWLPFTIEFLKCLLQYKNTLTIMTFGGLLKKILDPNASTKVPGIDYLKDIKMIRAPDAFFYNENYTALERFKPFVRLNASLTTLEHTPIYFVKKEI